MSARSVPLLSDGIILQNSRAARYYPRPHTLLLYWRDAANTVPYRVYAASIPGRTSLAPVELIADSPIVASYYSGSFARSVGGAGQPARIFGRKLRVEYSERLWNSPPVGFQGAIRETKLSSTEKGPRHLYTSLYVSYLLSPTPTHSLSRVCFIKIEGSSSLPPSRKSAESPLLAFPRAKYQRTSSLYLRPVGFPYAASTAVGVQKEDGTASRLSARRKVLCRRKAFGKFRGHFPMPSIYPRS